MGQWKFIFRNDLYFSDGTDYELPFLFDTDRVIVESDFYVKLIQYQFYNGFGRVYIKSYSCYKGLTLIVLDNSHMYRLAVSSAQGGSNRFSLWVPYQSDLAS